MFDDRLKNLRIARNMSQVKVAKALNLKLNTYRNYENNEREPNSAILIQLAKYFNVSIDYLLGFSLKDEGTSLYNNKLYGKINTLYSEQLEELDEFLNYLVWKAEKERGKLL